MADSNDQVSVERTIAAPAAEIFALLADPTRHQDIDGSGSVRAAKEPAQQVALGSRFGMSMRMGVPYAMENTVIEFEADRRIAWQTTGPGRVGRHVGGRIWRYELEPVDGGTLVRETWDISQESPFTRPVVRRGANKTRKGMAATLERIDQLLTNEPTMDDTALTLPGCPTPIAPLGVGTWAWGDRSTWGMGGYDDSLTEETIAGAWEASIDAGLTLFDTAEIYGDGESERIIGRLLARDPARRSSLVLATKWMPMPQKLDVKGAMRTSLERSIERLGVESVDLYQIHGPISLRSKAALAEALAEVHQAGLTAAVGVSNYSIGEMTKIHGELAKRGLPLATNQVEYSLLRRGPETGGLLEACRKLGVVLLAYSPIGQGRLTGKYTAAAPPPGKRGFSAHPMEQVDAVVAVLRRVGEAHDRTPSQVALRWLIEKGAVPIPGAKNAEQARANVGALGWTLTPDEVTTLDAAALTGTRSLANRFWQHG